ncbi:MAG: TIGR04372 family glycosyltransferase [Rhodospirillaceae bacterium]|jgi:putative glycosyltransferase (TIGR04372 family)|nr:TIGR04372 family glycosyltransferase [Rhodospirillaceae bacterium]MBT5014103.1 TIGR04372 family glycosyltransferase [Rhodospirillaceae bacterium]MBT5307908.1 TIGR04372 family glycosyltransferase [Rhodospirillaceae bacterium]MBT6407381.1 TIGR04372 family glycosyltransferase [Rhodospirillaceae bacterium]MBT7356936.1 TIGR04372 family glycosyltransferase [Rhodospirillaceae bacterium]
MTENVRVFDPHFLITRIGEMAIQLGNFVRMQQMGWMEPMTGVVLAPVQHVANSYLLDYFARWVTVERNDCSDRYPPYDATRITLPNGLVVPHDRANVAISKVWEEQGRGPLLQLHDEHREAGENALLRLGLPTGAWFVVLHVREQGYVEAQGHMADDHNDSRNADIETYRDAAKAIVDAGGWVIRLGDEKMTPLSADMNMDGVVDYAHQPLRNEWMDVYLMGAARFMIGTTSGPAAVSPAFGVPVIMTNGVPFFERPVTSRDLYICKRHLDADGQPIRFDDLMRPPHLSYEEPPPTTVVDNTAEEILAVTREMLGRLDGTVAYSDEDETLQAIITGLSDEFESYGVASRMGRDFLSNNKDLLS